MPSINATPVPDKGYVRVEVDCRDIPEMQGVVLKRWPTAADPTTVTPAYVRGSMPLKSLNGSTPDKPYVALSRSRAVFYDYEAPFGVPVTYGIESDADTYTTFGANLIGNPSFEADTSGWSSAYPTENTLTRTVATNNGWPVNGSASLMVQTTAANYVPAPQYANIPVGTGLPGIPSPTYVAYGFVLTQNTSRVARMVINWISAFGVTLATTQSAAWVPLTPNQPLMLSLTAKAPESAVKATVQLAVFDGVTVGGGLPINEQAYFDHVQFMQVNTSTRTWAASPSVTLAQPSSIGWLKDPARPRLNIPLQCGSADIAAPCDTGAGAYFIGLAGRQFAADAKTMDIPGAARGTAAYSARKDFTSTLRLVTRTLPDRDALEAILATGAPLLLQLPPEYGERDQYVQVGQYTEDRLTNDHRTPWRAFTLPYVVEDAPIGPAQGPAGMNWADLSAYPTWTALKATGKTWGDLSGGGGATVVDTATPRHAKTHYADKVTVTP